MRSQPKEEKINLQGNGRKNGTSQSSLLSLTMFQIQTSKCELVRLVERAVRIVTVGGTMILGQPCLYIHMHTLLDIFVLQMFQYLVVICFAVQIHFVSNLSTLKTMSSVLYVVIFFARYFFLVYDELVWNFFFNLLLVTNLSWHIVTKAIPSLQTTR